MAGDVANMKICSPFKLRSGLRGNGRAICHYLYDLPSLWASFKNHITKTDRQEHRQFGSTVLD